MLRKLALAATLLLIVVFPSQAQVRVGLSAFVGGYLPTNSLFEQIRLSGDTTGPIVLNLGQKTAPIVGGRITVRVLKQLAIDMEGGFAFSNLNTPPTADPDASDKSTVILASLSAMWIFYEAPFSPLNFYLSAGVGWNTREGNFWRNWEGISSFGGTFGVGMRYGLTSLLGLRFDIRDYVYKFEPTVSNFTFSPVTQNDIILTVAVDFVFSPVQ